MEQEGNGKGRVVKIGRDKTVFMALKESRSQLINIQELLKTEYKVNDEILAKVNSIILSLEECNMVLKPLEQKIKEIV